MSWAVSKQYGVRVHGLCLDLVLKRMSFLQHGLLSVCVCRGWNSEPNFKKIMGSVWCPATLSDPVPPAFVVADADNRDQELHLKSRRSILVHIDRTKFFLPLHTPPHLSLTLKRLLKDHVNETSFQSTSWVESKKPSIISTQCLSGLGQSNQCDGIVWSGNLEEAS